MASTPEQPTPALSVFDDAYATRTAPWVIGQPQPAIVTLERKGWIQGKVLDVGCGTGEHTIYFSALGYDVYGLDSSPRAVEQARTNAAARNVEVHFQVADALALGDDPTYDTVIEARCSTFSTQTTAPNTCAVCTAPVGRARLCTSSRCQIPGPASDRRSATPRSARPSANDGYCRTCALHSIEA